MHYINNINIIITIITIITTIISHILVPSSAFAFPAAGLLPTALFLLLEKLEYTLKS